ncbi:unnamed protein product [Zymoseptoria tritici ST99CH_3D1]|nr:unnamed protein product [Zymoseptoria tritici ST99CH_3D1]
MPRLQGTLTKVGAALSAAAASNDQVRMYENMSYDDALSGKQVSFSAAWIRNALAFCAKRQISAHCLPQDPKELTEFMHAVGWDVTDEELFTVLATKLLSWLSRTITNKNLSPAMIETKKNPDQTRMADWENVWAAYTLRWIDPSFDFILRQTSPKPPAGMKNLPPRPSVQRQYKSAGALIAATANGLGSLAAPKAGLLKKSGVVLEASAEEESVVVQDLQDLEAESVQNEPDLPLALSDLVHPQKSAAVPATKIHKPAKNSLPSKAPIPVEIFAAVTADPLFLDWQYEPSSVTLGPLQESSFNYALSHPDFMSWWQADVKAKMKATFEKGQKNIKHRGYTTPPAKTVKTAKKTSTKRAVPVFKKKVQFRSASASSASSSSAGSMYG